MGVLIRLIKSMNDALHMTSIVVSHDVQETLSIADYVYILSAGKVVGKGTPEALQRSGSDWVKQFINAQPDGPVKFHYQADDFKQDLISGGRK